jgi:hypothetical protein
VTIEEYAARYSRLPAYGSAGHEGNFREDQALVDYLLNACSTVDCLVFAAFSIGAGLDADCFSTDTSDLRRINRWFVANRYEISWSTERLSALLVEIRDNPGFRLLFDIRDVVTHRGGLPRTLYVGGEFSGRVTIPSSIKEVPDMWSSDLVIGAPSVADWQRLLEDVLRRAASAILSFRPLQASAATPDVDASP